MTRIPGSIIIEDKSIIGYMLVFKERLLYESYYDWGECREEEEEERKKGLAK